MCGRFWMDDGESEELHRIVGEINRRAPDAALKSSGEIFPTDTVPVVASNRRADRSAFAMQWGYTLPDGRRVINARSETAGTRPLFRDGMLKRRCAIPALRYFEWARAGGGKTRYAVAPKGGGLFYMAGIYRLEDERPVFAILTRAPADSIAFIHDRMPVILPTALVPEWIDPRRPAEGLLERAVLDVDFRRDDGPEQLAMRLD